MTRDEQERFIETHAEPDVERRKRDLERDLCVVLDKHGGGAAMTRDTWWLLTDTVFEQALCMLSHAVELEGEPARQRALTMARNLVSYFHDYAGHGSPQDPDSGPVPH